MSEDKEPPRGSRCGTCYWYEKIPPGVNQVIGQGEMGGCYAMPPQCTSQLLSGGRQVSITARPQVKPTDRCCSLYDPLWSVPCDEEGERDDSEPN